MPNELSPKAQKNLVQERRWLSRRVAGDAVFAGLLNTRRGHVYFGEYFVYWSVVGGQPAMKALMRVDNIHLGESGLSVRLGVVRPGQEEVETFFFGHQPLKVSGLDLYLWLPAFAEVRYTPMDYSNPESKFHVSVPIVIRSLNRSDEGQDEGCSYFASKSEFVALWPASNF